MCVQSSEKEIPCHPTKYNECFGLPPMRPMHCSLLRSDLMQGMYIGLTASPPRRIGTIRTTARQRQDDSTAVASVDDTDSHSSSRSCVYTAQTTVVVKRQNHRQHSATTTTTTNITLTAVLTWTWVSRFPRIFFLHSIRKRTFEDQWHRIFYGPDILPVTQTTVSKQWPQSVFWPHPFFCKVGWLELNVPFQHKYGYIRDERSGVESYPLTLWRKASDILTSTLAAFLFSSHPKRERDREAHLNYYTGEDNYRTTSN